MSSKLDWEKANRTAPRPIEIGHKHIIGLGRIIDNSAKKRELRQKMDEALAKDGWKKCPKCGGGRHPYFDLCSKCNFNKRIDDLRIGKPGKKQKRKWRSKNKHKNRRVQSW